MQRATKRGKGMRGAVRRGGVALTLCVLSSGCFGPSAAAQAELERTQQGGKALEASFDQVEERLLGNQAKLQLWREMAERRKSVTQVACTNSAFHVNQMVALRERQVEKSRRRRSPATDSLSPETGIGGPAATVGVGN